MAPRADDLIDRRSLRRKLTFWRVATLLVAVAAILAIAAWVHGDGLSGTGSDHIAKVRIEGTITEDEDLLKRLDRIRKSATVKGVILAIDSPGGTTAGGEELYEALGALRAKKPVVAVISELGASAAYMTAIGADRIFARRLSIVGSIGVLFQHLDAGKLLDTVGVNLDKVQTGPLKAEPDINEPLQGEVRASLQALVDDSFQWFVDVVSERRGIPRPQTLALSDGRILTGRQGVDLKLIDAIGGESEAIAWLEADKSVAADLPVVSYFPPPAEGWFGVTRWLGQSAAEMVRSGVDEAMSLDGLVSLWQAAPPM